MPDPEEKSWYHQGFSRRNIFLKICDEEASEQTFLHPHIYDIKPDAHQNESDSGRLYNIARKRESCYKKLYLSGRSIKLKHNKLNKKAYRIEKGTNTKSLKAVTEKDIPFKTDVFPLKMKRFKHHR